MEKVKELLNLLLGSRMVVEGKGRTFVKAPLWLTVLAALASLHLAVLTVVLIVAFGMTVRLERAE